MPLLFLLAYLVAPVASWAQTTAEAPECFLDRYTTPTSGPDSAFDTELNRLKDADQPPLPRYLPYPVYNMKLTAGEQTYAIRFLKSLSFPDGYDDCTNLECLFEKTYAESFPEKTEWAKVISYWYEKTGYGVSTGPNDGLFEPEELRGMWVLANLLPDFYRKLPTLSDFHRIPNGYVGDDGAVGVYYPGSRQIEIAQLTTRIANHRLLGTFHHTLVHEMSHAFDRSIGTPNGWFSESPEWMGLSQWQRLSRNDWKAVDGNFVSVYAATSPNEDFAESMAYFILEPDTLKKIAPEKFELISKKFFDGKAFDTDSLHAAYLAQLQAVASDGEAAVREKLAQIKQNDYYACGALTPAAEATLIQQAVHSTR